MRQGHFQQRVLLVVLTLSMLAMIASSASILYHSDRQSEISDKLLKVNALASQIIYFDEALTMSARMYAFSQDQKWVNRYDKMAIDLEQALNEAVKLEPSIQVMVLQTAAVNKQLIKIETQAIEQVQNGLKDSAQALLLGDEYLSLKVNYANQMELAFDKIQESSENLRILHNQQYELFSIILTLLSVAFIVIWFYLLNFLRLNSQRLHQLVSTDDLTGLNNRRRFDQILEQELRRSIRDERILMLAVIDLDNFKKYNDRYGHPKGDQVLALFGRIIKKSLRRASEFGFRVGGEEFAVIATVNNHQEGVAIVEKIKRKLKARAIEHEMNESYGIMTFSAGIAYHHAEDIMTDEELYSAADRALYQAKEQGRNRLVEHLPTES